MEKPAIEIRNLSGSFRRLYAVDHLSMTMPVGAIYGFIGENVSGKSTTEKLICGHMMPNEGTMRLFGRDYTDPSVRVRAGALIENARCLPCSSVPRESIWRNIKTGTVVIDMSRLGRYQDYASRNTLIFFG